MKLTLARSGWLALVAALATLAPVSLVSAATYTWNSTSTGSWFSSSVGQLLSAGWDSPGSPLGTTNDIQLNSAINLEQNFGGTVVATVNNLEFLPGNTAVITGNGAQLIITGNLTNSASTLQTIGNVLDTPASQLTFNSTSTIDTGAAGITIARNITGGGAITKTGAGTLTYGGVAASGASFTNAAGFNGLLTVSSGSLAASIPALTTFGGSIQTNSTAGINVGTVSGSVGVSAGNNTMLQGANTVNSLTVTGGTVNAGPGQVTTSFTQSGGVVNNLFKVGGSVLTTGGTTLLSNAFGSGGLLTLGGVTKISGGPGSIITGSSGVTLSSGGNLNLEFNNAGNNQFVNAGGGVLSYGGTLSLNLTTGGTSANGTIWPLFTNFSSTSGSFDGIVLNTLVGGQYASLNGQPFFLSENATDKFDYRYGPGMWLSNWSNGQRFIFNQSNGQLTIVPEPSTFVFAGIGAAMLGWQTWAGRRRKARMKLIEEHTRKLSEQRGLV